MSTSKHGIPSFIVHNDLKKYKYLFLKCCSRRITLPRNTIISQNEKDSGSTFFLLSGMVKIYTTNREGYNRILGYHRENTLFAMDRICGLKPPTVNLAAITDIEILIMTEKDIRIMGTIDPEFPYALLRYYGSVLRLMCVDAEAKSLPDVEARLISFICMYLKDDNQNPVLQMTRDELASAVNASQIQVIRICRDLQNRGLIECGRGFIRILDTDKLYGLCKL